MEASHDRASESIRRGNKIEVFLLFFALLVLALLVGVPYFIKSTLLTVVSDLGKIFFTLYISYVVTQQFAQKSAREDLRDLAESSGSRLFLLSSHIRELADEIMGYEPDGERSGLHYKTMASEMQRLATQAELSFQDMYRMAKLDISIPALIDEARTRVVEATRREEFECPYCKRKRELFFDMSPGATKHTFCDRCHKPFVIHRLPDGSIRFGFEEVFVVDCPNPKCPNRIKIKKKPTEYGTVIRNCYECFTRIKLSLDTQRVESFDSEEPLRIAEDTIKDGRGQCPY